MKNDADREFDRVLLLALEKAFAEGDLSDADLKRLQHQYVEGDMSSEMGFMLLRRLLYVDQAENEVFSGVSGFDEIGIEQNETNLNRILEMLSERGILAEKSLEKEEVSGTLPEQIHLLSPKGDEPLFPYLFCWQPVEDVKSYHFALRNNAGEVLCELETETNELNLSDETQLTADKTFTWQVSANVQGRTISGQAKVKPFMLDEKKGILLPDGFDKSEQQPAQSFEFWEIWKSSVLNSLRTRWKFIVVPLVPALILLMLIVSGPWREASPPVLRGPAEQVEVNIIAPIGLIQTTRPVFSWQVHGNESRAYLVRVMDSTLNIVLRLETTGTKVDFPSDAPSLEAGHSYTWQVTDKQKPDEVLAAGSFKVK